MNIKNKAKHILTGSKRLRFIGIFALTAIVAVGIVVAVSAQIGTVNKSSEQKKGDSVVDKVDRNPGLVIQQAARTDGQTGQVRPLTAAEAQYLADGIKELVNQSDEGLVEVTNPDGSVTVDLQGRFQNIAVAKKNADGTVDQSCLNTTQNAASFFGIDPKKFGDEAKKVSTVNRSERDAKGDEIK